MAPGRIAANIASVFSALPREVRRLDPGAGMGALTAAFVADACARKEKSAAIDVTAFEVHDQLAGVLTKTPEEFLELSAAASVSFTASIVSGEY